MMRNFLVTKILCAKCGTPLALEYVGQKSSAYCNGEPTGAAMVDIQVKAFPCECTIKAQRELDTLRAVIRGDE